MPSSAIKNTLKRSFLYQVIKLRRDHKALRAWEREGKPSPPPHIIKERLIKEYAQNFHTSILIETGTYLGQTVDAMKNSFDRIFSIEFDRTLYEEAKQLFSVYDHISILQGDSGEILGDTLASINEPCLFWLDSHYSGGITAKAALETPVKRELEHIFEHPVSDHVILIDDARCFTGDNDYPTLQELREFVSQKRPKWKFKVEDDIIRIHEPC